VPDLTMLEGRLEAVLADIADFRDEWERQGKPLFAKGAKGNEVAHPLIRMIRAAEASASRIERRHQVGRPLGSQSAPDRTSDRGGPPQRAGIPTP
jgi:hypothetical protein